MTKIISVLFFLFSLASAQNEGIQNMKSGNDARIGLKIGSIKTYPSSKVGYHNAFGFTFDKNINEKIYISADAEYFDKSFSYSQEFYKNGAYGDKLLSQWQNLSVDAALMFRLNDKGRLGFGLSSECFFISNNKCDSRGQWVGEVQTFIRPGVFCAGGLDFRLNNYFSFFIEGRYKTVLMGKEYGITKLNLLFSLQGYAGFKLDV